MAATRKGLLLRALETTFPVEVWGVFFQARLLLPGCLQSLCSQVATVVKL